MYAVADIYVTCVCYYARLCGERCYVMLSGVVRYISCNGCVECVKRKFATIGGNRSQRRHAFNGNVFSLARTFLSSSGMDNDPSSDTRHSFNSELFLSRSAGRVRARAEKRPRGRKQEQREKRWLAKVGDDPDARTMPIFRVETFE